MFPPYLMKDKPDPLLASAEAPTKWESQVRTMCWMIRSPGALTIELWNSWELQGESSVRGCAMLAVCVKQGLWKHPLGVKQHAEGFVNAFSHRALN